MAISKIKKIYKTEPKSIAYIVNPSKTKKKDEEIFFTEYFMCRNNPYKAAEDFETVRSLGTGRGKILAHHIIQSFKPNEITPEQAFLVGKKLAETYLKNEYQYVISTHVDKKHIHNHIIFCSTNMNNHKKFTTNQDKGKRCWKELRRLSDIICQENNLSVIEPEQKNNKYEDKDPEKDVKNNGISYKNFIKNIIDKTISESTDFKDFLKKLSEKKVDVVYQPQNVISLKFKIEGQQKYTRAKTLGWWYEEEQIRKRIEEMKFIRNLGENLHGTKLIDTDTEYMQNSPYLKRWADIHNIKEVSSAINFIAERERELTKMTAEEVKRQQQITAEIQRLNENIQIISELLTAKENYKKYKEVNREYEELSGKMFSKSKAKAYWEEHKKQLTDYENAKKKLNFWTSEGKTIPSEVELKVRISELYNDKRAYERTHKDVVEDIAKYKKAKMIIAEYRQKNYPNNEKPEPKQKQNSQTIEQLQPSRSEYEIEI
jgi:hypothetical protein